MSIPLFVDGETDLDAATFNLLVNAGNNSNTAITNRDIAQVNVRDHEVDPTGVADSYAGVLNAVEDALDKGRALSLAGCKLRMSQPLVISEPIVIDGGASGERQGFDTILGAELNFDADVPGVSLERQAIGSVLRNLAITSKTNYFGETLGGSETDDGLTVKAERWRLDQVSVRWFGRHGFYFDSVSHASDNADLGVATGIEAHYNGKDGIRLDGDDANACVFILPDLRANGRYGIYNNGAKNTFIAPHANGNDTADYHDAGIGSLWLNVYAESAGRFEIPSPGSNGFFLSSSTYAIPAFWTGNPLANNVAYASAANWFIQIGAVMHTLPQYTAMPTGVAVDIAAVHAALVSMNIIGA